MPVPLVDPSHRLRISGDRRATREGCGCCEGAESVRGLAEAGPKIDGGHILPVLRREWMGMDGLLGEWSLLSTSET